MLGIFLLSSISALDADYIGKQYETLNLFETCEVNGFACDSSFVCEITVIDSDHNVLVLNESMTRNETIYNYTLTNTSLLGEYLAPVYCNNITLSGKNPDGKITITTTGRAPHIKLMIFLLISAFILFVLSIYIQNHAIGFTAGALFLLTGIYLIIYGFGDIRDVYTQSLAWVIIGLGLFITIVASVEWLEEFDN